MKAGASVTLHTGSGTNFSANVYWGSRAYIWNNDGDKASVGKPSTSTNEDTCSWATVSSYKNCA